MAESYKAESLPEARPVLFGRTTNNPGGGLQAKSHSKETFMKANVIWGVGMPKKLRVRIATRNTRTKIERIIVELKVMTTMMRCQSDVSRGWLGGGGCPVVFTWVLVGPARPFTEFQHHSRLTLSVTIPFVLEGGLKNCCEWFQQSNFLEQRSHLDLEKDDEAPFD